MVDILKRSGRKQNFSLAKLQKAIDRAAKDAKMPVAKRKELCKEIAEGIKGSLRRKRSISAVDLRRRVLGRLDRRSIATSKAWRKFDRRRH
tara:strand:+ start:1329 stop:1601 length:273 start_codon:yes stop_codon:yes gene_type:complete